VEADAVGGISAPRYLLHGTHPDLAKPILREGLIPAQPVAVDLTEDLRQAVRNSLKDTDLAYTTAGVLLVDVTGLPLRFIGFYICAVVIPPERISRLDDHPALLRWLEDALLRRRLEDV
jgi:RNA:NAD 2'-phosphotransferase (TPT1/KptA family)